MNVICFGSFILAALSVPLPQNESLPEPIQETLTSLPALNIYRMMANVPTIFQAYIHFAQALFDTEGMLQPKYREIIFLREAYLLKSDYEWHQHEFLALANHLSKEEIEAIRKENPVVSLGKEGNFISMATDELTLKGTLTDSTLAELLKRYSADEATEIILMISFANMLGRFVNGTRVPIEKTNPLEGRASPTGN